MNIAFLDFYGFAYTCDTPAQEPLGGTQSAVAHLAAALARRGHGVTVLNAVPSAQEAAQVRFAGRDRLSSGFLNQFDRVVCVSAALGRELRSAGVEKPLLLWCHHDVDQPAVRNLRDGTERAAWDGFALLTRWQAGRYASTFGMAPSDQRILGNAAAPAFHALAPRTLWFERGGAPVLYYTSAPYRGLEVLLDAMPAVRKAMPETRLRVFSSMRTYGASAADDPHAGLYERCRATAGVEYVGALPQPQLAQAIAAADMHAYPSVFPETSCIAAMESMAAGSMIVASRLGALEETTAGFAALFEPGEDAAGRAERYAAFLVRCLQDAAADPSRCKAHLAAEREFARSRYSWDQRAEEWERWLAGELGRRGSRVGAPAPARSANSTGNLLKAAGDLPGAIAWYRRALEAEPDHAGAQYNLGMALHEAGRYEEAEAAFLRVLAGDPGDVDALFHLGVLRQRDGRHAQAGEAFRSALGRSPGHPHLWLRLGEVERVRDAPDSLQEAKRSFMRAAELQPDLAEAHFNLGLVCEQMGAPVEALAAYRRALALRPGDAACQAAVLAQMQQVCDWSGFEELCARRTRERPPEPDSPLPVPFGMLSIPASPAAQLACARAYSKEVERTAPAPVTPRAPRPAAGRADRLRLGYLSADLHEHVTAHVMVEVFELHDRARFETIAYSYGPYDGSPIRRRLEQAFERFVDLRGKSDAEAAEAIRADGVDVLVDLKGYTRDGRPGIAAARPAPVQASYLGFPATMGARFIDYIVTDRYVLPEAHRPFFDEKPAYLPHSYYPSSRGRPIEAPPPRAELGLPEQGIVFCCFNQVYKILPFVFDTWIRLLQALPGSVLWLLEANPAANDNLRREAARRGVDPARLVVAPRSSPEIYLRRLQAADLFLDTMPYNAHTTASDALWVGVPVVTCPGATLPSRVAASQLKALGMDELIAGSLEAYEALALRLAGAPDELRALRRKLAIQRGAAPLFDTPRYVRSLEALFERMREIHRAGEAPRMIELGEAN